jgi:hypothetical protein
MLLSQKTLEKLRQLINEETEYRSWSRLVSFFNKLWFKDVYSPGFPSRWIFTDEKLQKINWTSEIDRCIKEVLSPINFISKFEQLDSHIVEFNKYLTFDGWKIERNGKEILLKKAKQDDFIQENLTNDSEFTNREIKSIDIKTLPLDPYLIEILEIRLEEIEKCMKSNSPLAVILLAWSTLEWVLLWLASTNAKLFNESSTSAKDKNWKVKALSEWNLWQLIDTAKELWYLKEDVKKYSHSLRDFRNYIHPYQQLASQFYPDIDTAKISLQVLKVAILQISKYWK